MQNKDLYCTEKSFCWRFFHDEASRGRVLLVEQIANLLVVYLVHAERYLKCDSRLFLSIDFHK